MNEVSRTPPWRVVQELPERLFVVGDIHGSLAELDTLLSFLLDRLTERDQLVFIGDYIDRGPDSRGVIDALLYVQRTFPKTTFLRGNHEEMFLAFLNGPRSFDDPYFKRYGGRETFESYQLTPAEIMEEPLAHLPKEHLEFFHSLETGLFIAPWLMVHAGIRPHVPLAEQNAHDLLWIRDDFVSKPHELGVTVVFGHTPMQEVMTDLPFAIGIDTGVVYGNKLSCLELLSGTAYQVAAGESRISKRVLW